MSALLQGVPLRVAGGAIDETIGTLAPDHFANGIPYEADGTLAVSTSQPADHYHQGLPFTALGRLAVAGSATAPAYFGSGAAPFTVANLLQRQVIASDHFSSGVAYSGVGAIVTG